MLRISAFLLLFMSILSANSQPQPPSGNHENPTNQPPTSGGAAPIGSGTGLLILAASAYTIIRLRQEQSPEK